MSENMRVAVPTKGEGGLDSPVSGHFGQCDCFTTAMVNGAEISDVLIIKNTGHEEGGCTKPVELLREKGVNVLLAGGMGMRPLEALRQAGIRIYYCAGMENARSAMTAFGEGKLAEFGSEQLCKGCHGHHH